ncbi:hypothetical protein ZIOFF_033321 [Zingiber officinale]|uniref:DDE Tnp4 domain-containing protein n=1 Tax=Zingiber officinale TaxID=94328 RepID=A0A8J5LC59_ZINOF|nr:hypothetical protein ZIOFF_033321 [Zingiber officinale]
MPPHPMAISASTPNDASAKSPISSSFSPADSSSSPVDSSSGPSFSLPRLLQLLRHYLSLILLISSSFSPADSSSSSSPIDSFVDPSSSLPRLLQLLQHFLLLVITQPDGSEIPSLIQSNSRFYPYFKHCVGALDGTHIRVKVSDEDAPRYRVRKDWPTTNVLAACSFDLKFTYILSGWEGTSSDSRIVKNALSRRDKLLIPHGKYYLVDSGFMLKRGLITPYQGIRYHLKEYSRCGPTNAKELFNLRHASLRNAIERAFGANPSIKKWRYTPAPHYEKLFELFAYDRANGQGASTAVERNVEIIQEEEQRDDIHVSSKVDLDSSPFVEGLKKRKITSVDAYGNKKSSALDSSIKEVVAAIDHSSSVIENKSFRQQKLNEKLYKDLVSVSAPDENILDVYLFLGENKEKMMLVMRCPVQKRLALLKKMFSF